jgi:GST-like protein
VSTRQPKGYTLYGSHNSGAVAVEAALDLVRARYRFVDAASWRDKAARAKVERFNPLGQIPTLVCPDGSVLTESAAILIHLALAHPRAKLLPSDPMQRAQVLRALVFIAANCYAAIGAIDYPERWLGRASSKADRDAMRAGARKRLHQLWSVFADEFGNRRKNKGPYLFGDRLSAADLLAAVVSRWSGARKHLAKKHPALHATLERIDAHPVMAAVFGRRWLTAPPPP